jgi:hypothetical protein
LIVIHHTLINFITSSTASLSSNASISSNSSIHQLLLVEFISFLQLLRPYFTLLYYYIHRLLKTLHILQRGFATSEANHIYWIRLTLTLILNTHNVVGWPQQPRPTTLKPAGQPRRPQSPHTLWMTLENPDPKKRRTQSTDILSHLRIQHLRSSGVSGRLVSTGSLC